MKASDWKVAAGFLTLTSEQTVWRLETAMVARLITKCIVDSPNNVLYNGVEGTTPLQRIAMVQVSKSQAHSPLKTLCGKRVRRISRFLMIIGSWDVRTYFELLNRIMLCPKCTRSTHCYGTE